MNTGLSYLEKCQYVPKAGYYLTEVYANKDGSYTAFYYGLGCCIVVTQDSSGKKAVSLTKY